MSEDQTTAESPAIVKKVVESDEFKHALKKAVDRAVSDINAGDIDGMDSAVEDALSASLDRLISFIECGTAGRNER